MYAVIDVSDVRKSFRLPREQTHTLKEKALHPFRREQVDVLDALKGVSLQVAEGEFLGIVGRNGSGKSTLLKCLAGIYSIDSGRIQVAGTISPFIELGVGFNPDLPAVDNIVLNAVMLGLARDEAAALVPEVLEFAELERFAGLKLKNYSSGMQVRLAFAVMVHASPGILLFDEVLAVGDAAFQRKCLDVFERLKAEGRTIVLVTHDMLTVERFCDRAVLLERGVVDFTGPPEEAARRYLELNFRRASSTEEGSTDGLGGEVLDVWLEDADGERVESVGAGDPLHLRARIRVDAGVESPRVDMWVDDERDTRLFATSTMANGAALEPLRGGETLTVRCEVEHRLGDGRYHVGCSLLDGQDELHRVVALHHRAASFISYGATTTYGSVQLDHSLDVDRRS